MSFDVQPRRRLTSLRKGDRATVAGVDPCYPEAKRLADLGFVTGATVEMLRPGQPCIVRVAHTRLGLSEGLQDCVLLMEA